VQVTPLVKMYTLGHTFIPAGIHAGGLRYHGMAPLISALYNQGYIEAVAVHQIPTFAAAIHCAVRRHHSRARIRARHPHGD
jgi:tryptophan synthase beta chain